MSHSSTWHLDHFSRFCTGHPLVQTPTGRGNFRGDIYWAITPCMDCSIVYPQASKSVRKSTLIHSTLTTMHYNRSIYSHYKNLHYKISISSQYKINITVSSSLTFLFSTNMAISEIKGQGWRVIRTQWRKASDILTSTLDAFLFSSHPKRERDREAHLNYYASAYNRGDNYHIAREK